MRAGSYALVMQHATGFTGPDIPSDSIANQCVRCGLCLPTCPTYVETLVETSGPRGRIALIKAVGEGRLDVTSPGFVHQMSECLDCRACEAVCPSGVQYGALLEAARSQVVRATAAERPPLVSLTRRVLIGWLFSDLRRMRFVARLIRLYQRSGLQSLARNSGLLRLLRLDKQERLAPAVSPRFFVPRDQTWEHTAAIRTAKVFMHAGCVMHVAFAEVDDATVRVLQKAGCDVTAPAAQGCCGAIAVHAGDLELGRAMARRNIEAFERSSAVYYIVNAAGCGSALKEYGHLLKDDPQWAGRAAAFSAKVRDVCEFLADNGIGPELGPLDAVVTYQEPCHLAHAQRISAAPRWLLAQIPGVTVRDHAEATLCCGSAGIYNLTQPEMSARLRKRKIENILGADPSIVATANPGCALQVAAGLNEAGRPLEVRHVVELLDKSYANYRAS